MNGIAGFALAIFIYPGLLAALVAGWLLFWVRDLAHGALGAKDVPGPLHTVARLRATYQSETFISEGMRPAVLTVSGVVAVVFPLLALIFLPVPANPLVSLLGFSGDLVVEAALLLGLPLARLAVGWATPTDAARRAADRAARLLAGASLPLALALIAAVQLSGVLSLRSVPSSVSAVAVLAQVLAAAAFACALPVLARRFAVRQQGETLPAPEGEEGEEGELAGITGRDLALFRLGEMLQLVAVCGVFVGALILPLVQSVPDSTHRTLIWIVGVVLTAAGIGAWEGVRGTSEPGNERPPLTWWLGIPVLLALAALVVAAWATRG